MPRRHQDRHTTIPNNFEVAVVCVLTMKDKDLDYIVLNYANEENAGFEVNTNRVIIFSKLGLAKEFSLDRKDRIANQLVNFIINNK